MQIESSRRTGFSQAGERQRTGSTHTVPLSVHEQFPQTQNHSDLPAAWVSFLSRYHWDLFGSLTFRECTHPESALKRFRLFVSMINRKLYGPRWAKHHEGLSWCVAMERQERGVIHFHCLLADPHLVELLKGAWFKSEGRWANEFNEVWNELAGFARIEPIQVAELVANYVAKYVTKGGQIDLGGPLMERGYEQAPTLPDVTTGQPGGRGLENYSDSVPGLPVAAGRRGELVNVQDTLTCSPHSFLTGWSAEVRSRNERWPSRKRAHGAPVLVEQVLLSRVTTPEERAKLLARFSTSTRRETADLLNAVRVRVLAYKAGHFKPVA